MAPKKRISISVTPDQYTQLEQEAERRGKRLTTHVSDIVIERMDINEINHKIELYCHHECEIQKEKIVQEVAGAVQQKHLEYLQSQDYHDLIKELVKKVLDEGTNQTRQN